MDDAKHTGGTPSALAVHVSRGDLFPPRPPARDGPDDRAAICL